MEEKDTAPTKTRRARLTPEERAARGQALIDKAMAERREEVARCLDGVKLNLNGLIGLAEKLKDVPLGQKAAAALRALQ